MRGEVGVGLFDGFGARLPAEMIRTGRMSSTDSPLSQRRSPTHPLKGKSTIRASSNETGPDLSALRVLC